MQNARISMTLLQIFPHKNDEVTIVVSDVNTGGSTSLDAADHNGRFSRSSTSRYPQKWSDVKASLIAANIFSARAGEGMERADAWPGQDGHDAA